MHTKSLDQFKFNKCDVKCCSHHCLMLEMIILKKSLAQAGKVRIGTPQVERKENKSQFMEVDI